MKIRLVSSGWGPWIALVIQGLIASGSLAAGPIPNTVINNLPNTAPTTVNVGTLTIPVPCNPSPVPSGSPGPFNILRSCQNVIYGEAATGRAPAVPGLLSNVYNQVVQHMTCAYQGVDLDTTKATNPGVCAGDTFGQPCSLVPHPFNNNTSESNTDYQGHSCGAQTMNVVVNHGHCATPQGPEEQQLLQIIQQRYGYTQAQIDAMAQTPQGAQQLQQMYNQLMAPPSPVPSALITATATQNANCVYFNATKPYGELERAWNRGAFLQALTYWTSQTLNQITCNGSITMANDPSTNGCAAFAQDVLANISSTLQTQQTLTAMIGAQPNAQDIVNCKADWDPNPSNTAVDPGRIRNSAQHLCAARASLESMFTHLVMCNIYQQARVDYNAKMGLTEAQRQSWLIGVVAQQINNQTCHAQCNGSSDYGAATSCSQACYNANIQPALKGFYQGFWPINQANSCSGVVGGQGGGSAPPGLGIPYTFTMSQNSPGNSSGVGGAGGLTGGGSGPAAAKPIFQQPVRSFKNFFGLFGGTLSPLFARGGEKRRKKRSKRVYVKIALALVVTAFLFACGGAQNLPSVPTTSGNNTSCAGGDPNCCGTTPPPSCPTEHAGLPGTTNSNGAGAAEAGNAGLENGAAGTLASGANGNGSGAHSAATGGSPGSGRGSTSAGGAATGDNSGGVSTAGTTASSGSNGAMSYGSGSGSLGGNVGTDPSANPSAVPSGDGSGALTYGGGGAGGAGSGGSSNGGFKFGLGMMAETGLNGAASGDQSFGNTGETPAMSGSDPADYFTRIGVDDSLFKKVENRYRATSMQWASSNTLSVKPASISGAQPR